MFKKIVLYAIASLAIAHLYSCKTSRQLPYFKDLPETTAVSKIATQPYEPLKLQANDELQITISSASPEASHFFNLVATSAAVPVSASTVSVSTPSQGFNNLYRVSFNGNITMPVLGDMKIAGLTTEQVKLNVMEKLKGLPERRGSNR
jgi:polysaccharide export outer membrane protein